jgi:hypothetical protein
MPNYIVALIVHNSFMSCLCVEDAWDEGDEWGDLDVTPPVATLGHAPTKAKATLSIPRKSGGKGD